MDKFDFDKIMAEESEYGDIIDKGFNKNNVSPAVIKRLPRYFRYLRELIRNGKSRISSGELSEIMHVTASQIRQDLNCFGGFGQQGYGYNVNYLYAKICEILGVGMGFRAIIIGAGNLGTALVRNPMFEKRGVDVAAMFDVDPGIIGKTIAGIKVYDMKDLEKFCAENHVDIAVLTLPKEAAQQAAERIVKCGIRGIWNFTGKEFDFDRSSIIVENVHLGDSLMTLCYELCRIAEAKGAEVSDDD
jgi:redox-sensing transcriptional repressor